MQSLLERQNLSRTPWPCEDSPKPREKDHAERLLEHLIDHPVDKWEPDLTPKEDSPFDLSYITTVEFEGVKINVKLDHHALPNLERKGYSQRKEISVYRLTTTKSNPDRLHAPISVCLMDNDDERPSYELADQLMLRVHIHFEELTQ